MKNVKRILSVLLAIAVIAVCFAGCSSKTNEKYSDETLIIGYTEDMPPFISVDENGKATGFEVDLFDAIFDDVKGDLKSYRFEKVEKGYTLEEDGGFFDSNEKEYSAGLLFGCFKNDETFNEDYSYTEPIITNRVVAVTAKNSKIKSFADFKGARVAVVGDAASKALDKNSSIKASAASLTAVKSFDEIEASLGTIYDVAVVDEFGFYKDGASVGDDFVVLNGSLDTIEYVLACAKNSGWMWSLNEAIREMKSEKYGDGDTFTPLVEKYFGYNASSFEYNTEGDN